jgi:uncharacterized membrane protein YgaE (UPF0421/DUF939 family)
MPCSFNRRDGGRQSIAQSAARIPDLRKSAQIVTDLSAARTRQLSGPRLAGTVAGAALGAVLSPLGGIHDIGAIMIGVGIFVAVFISHFLRMKEAAKVAGYVCGVVLLTHSDRPLSYALFRVLETAPGSPQAYL